MDGVNIAAIDPRSVSPESTVECLRKTFLEDTSRSVATVTKIGVDRVTGRRGVSTTCGISFDAKRSRCVGDNSTVL